MLKFLYNIILPLSALCCTLASCHKHEPFPDTSMQVGNVLCTDGSVLSMKACAALDKKAIAVVFHVNYNPESEDRAYAVYMDELPRASFADSLGVRQNSSSDVKALDGNANTYAIYSTKEMGSPMAESVFAMWEYGQSAYIPSVAQIELLYHQKDKINLCLERIGGTPIPEEPNECWYWTSTEVSGQEEAKAWLFSLSSGTRHETPKDEQHKIRPIVTIY